MSKKKGASAVAKGYGGTGGSSSFAKAMEDKRLKAQGENIKAKTGFQIHPTPRLRHGRQVWNDDIQR